MKKARAERSVAKVTPLNEKDCRRIQAGQGLLAFPFIQQADGDPEGNG